MALNTKYTSEERHKARRIGILHIRKQDLKKRLVVIDIEIKTLKTQLKGKYKGK